MEDLPTCPICFELLKQPRKLPACSHLFCEHCIFTYLDNLKTKRCSAFHCPVCKHLNPCPSNNDNTLEWIHNRLSLDTETVLKVKSYASMELCTTCKKLRKSSAAVRYCFDCQDTFCKMCSDIGHTFRNLQDHTTIEIKEGGNLSKIRADKEMTRTVFESLACPEHPRRNFQFLCTDDDILCCQTCAILHHRNCNTVVELELYVTEEGIDTDSRKLSKSVHDLIVYGQTVIEAIKANEPENKIEAENIKKKIGEMRTKINILFDALENSSDHECSALTKKYSLSANENIKIVQEVIDKLSMYSTLMEVGVKQDSKPLSYALYRKLKEDFKECETALLEMADDFKKYGLILQVEGLLGSLMELSINETEKLAAVKETESNLPLPKYNGRQLLKYCSVTEVDVHDVSSSDYPGSWPYFSDAVYCPNNRILLVDFNHGYCCLLNETYNPVASCNFMTYNTEKEEETRKPYGATHMSNNLVAVSVPSSKKIYFVSVGEGLEIKGELSTLHTPKALHGFSNGDLAVSLADPVAFGIITPTGCYCHEVKLYFDRDKTGRVLKSFDYMAIDDKKSHVIQPCTIDKAVYCFDLQGNPKFKYTHEELELPQGLSLDGDGNVYVCDKLRNSIHILSSCGLPIRVLREGCPERPLALSFDLNGITFVVTRTSDTPFDGKMCEIHQFRLE